MDRNQEELKFLSLYGMYKEACKMIYSSYKKPFHQITIYLILPLSFLLLVDDQTSRIFQTTNQFKGKQANTQIFNKLWTHFYLFKAGYYVLLLVLSSLSTTSIAYAASCSYLGQQVTIKKLRRFIKKVWKIVMFTLFCSHVSILVYIKMIIFDTEWLLKAFGYRKRAVSYTHSHCNHYHHFSWRDMNLGLPNWNFQSQTLISFLTQINFTGILRSMLIMGLFYVSIIWEMACVVSALEEASMMKTIIKSMKLIEGNKRMRTAMFLVMSTSVIIINREYEKLYFVGGSLLDLVVDLVIGISCLWFLCQILLLCVTVQAIAYFVCKSYHHENIDSSVLLDDH